MGDEILEKLGQLLVDIQSIDRAIEDLEYKRGAIQRQIDRLLSEQKPKVPKSREGEKKGDPNET